MASPSSHAIDPPVHVARTRVDDQSVPALLERRGRFWIFGSFALCPCHLPLTLGVVVTVLGGTAAGAVLRDHIVLAGIVITAAWAAGTWRGFRLVRLAQRGACPLPATPQDLWRRRTGPQALPAPTDASHDDSKRVPGGCSDDVVERKLDMDVDRHGA